MAEPARRAGLVSQSVPPAMDSLTRRCGSTTDTHTHPVSLLVYGPSPHTHTHPGREPWAVQPRYHRLKALVTRLTARRCLQLWAPSASPLHGAGTRPLARPRARRLPRRGHPLRPSRQCWRPKRGTRGPPSRRESPSGNRPPRRHRRRQWHVRQARGTTTTSRPKTSSGTRRTMWAWHPRTTTSNPQPWWSTWGLLVALSGTQLPAVNQQHHGRQGRARGIPPAACPRTSPSMRRETLT